MEQLADSAGVEERELQAGFARLYERWIDAWDRHDQSALCQLIAPEFTYTDIAGRLWGREQYLAMNATYEDPDQVTSFSNIKVRLYGSVAVVNGTYEWRAIPRNRDPFTISPRFTATWVESGEQWWCVAHHTTIQMPGV